MRTYRKLKQYTREVDGRFIIQRLDRCLKAGKSENENKENARDDDIVMSFVVQGLKCHYDARGTLLYMSIDQSQEGADLFRDLKKLFLEVFKRSQLNGIGHPLYSSVDDFCEGTALYFSEVLEAIIAETKDLCCQIRDGKKPDSTLCLDYMPEDIRHIVADYDKGFLSRRKAMTLLSTRVKLLRSWLEVGMQYI